MRRHHIPIAHLHGYQREIEKCVDSNLKSDIKKYPDSDILEVIVAFANTEGGDVYLSIEDSREITGVNSAHKNPITLSAYIANNTIPPISVRADIIDAERPVLKLSVPKSYNGIIATSSGQALRRRIKAGGTPENVVMYSSEFATRLSDLRLLDYSAMPIADATIKDFDLLAVEQLQNYMILSLAKHNAYISPADVVKFLYIQGEKAYKLLRKLVR